MYNNILIGYDDSEYSLAAVREVAAWIKRHGGDAKLVHGVYFDEEEFGIKPELLKARTEAGRAACDRARDIADLCVRMEAMVREGDPPEVIIDTASAMDTDLIALGTYGRKGIGRMLIGSVTARVISRAPCDILIVKRACGECSGKYARILVAYDGSPASGNALQKALELARLDGSEVSVMYVIPRYQEMINFFKTEGISSILNREAEKILDQARTACKQAGINVNTTIAEGSPAEVLVDWADRNNSDLIVMGSCGWQGLNRTLIGSTAERVIMQSERPVLVTR